MPSSRKRHALPPVHAGLILICDIVDFSRLTQNEQVRAVESLWGLFDLKKYRPWLKRSRFNGTGDGLMIACSTAEHREFVKLALALIKRLGKGRTPLGLRVGLHEGPFSQPKPKGAPDHQAIGTGVNQCARLCPLADAGDIAISEKFVQGWFNREGKKIWAELSPSIHEAPIEVFIKHGETLQVRFYRAKQSAHHAWPHRIQMYDLARAALIAQLKDIEQVVVESLAQSFPRATASVRDVRVSLFAELRTPAGTQLRATDLRYHRQGAHQDAGVIAYPTDAGGAGAVGRAFCLGKCQAINRLPEPVATPGMYVTMLSRESGLAAEQINQFRRKAQTFIAFPFGLPGGAPDGAICVDVMDPLDAVSRKDLVDFAKQLSLKYGSILALYWRLRAQQ